MTDYEHQNGMTCQEVDDLLEENAADERSLKDNSRQLVDVIEQLGTRLRVLREAVKTVLTEIPSQDLSHNARGILSKALRDIYQPPAKP